MSARSPRALVACVALLSACGAPRTMPDTEGATVTPGQCGRGLVVAESDYQSTNVSLLGYDGTVLSPSLASSSVQAGGFGVALSGDVVSPSNATPGANVVLIDRTPVGVLRFVDIASARVVSELPVGTGFRANPHDYLLVGVHEAYVSRYDSNPNPGTQPLDAGGDVLLVDPTVPAITGRIDLAPAMAGELPGFTPNPGRMARVGERVFVLLASFASDYMSATSSRLVELSPTSDSIVTTLVLDGAHGCDAFAVSPDGKELAVTCTGGDTLSTVPKIEASAVVLVDISGAPQITKRFAASTFGTNAVGFAVDYTAQNRLLFGTLGYLGGGATEPSLDALIELDTAAGAFDEILRSESQPFTLGDVRCAPLCGACFVADAERSGGSVLRLALGSAGGLGAPSAIRAETQIGLPPRYLGAF